MRLLRVFVSGTDTGVGKTEAALALLSLLRDANLAPAAMKPFETGVVDGQPADALALWRAAGSGGALDQVCPNRYPEPLAPGVAALRERRRGGFARALRAFHAFDGRSLVVEGAGGLFVPVDRRRDMIDLAAAMKLPVLVVARAGLGTLNHTALSLHALRQRRIRTLAVLLVRGAAPDPSEKDNAAWIARRNGVRVLGPVPFEPDPRRRRVAFRRVLRDLARP